MKIPARSPIFRHIVASILVLTLLGYGTAWAYSGHANDVAGHEISDMHEHTPTDLDDDGCDHCCHAGAHLLGLAIQPSDTGRQSIDLFRIFIGPPLVYSAHAPPLKPPRI